MSAWNKAARAQIAAQLGEGFERCAKGGFPHYARGVAFEGWELKETGGIVVFRSHRGVIGMVMAWRGVRKGGIAEPAQSARVIAAWERLHIARKTAVVKTTSEGVVFVDDPCPDAVAAAYANFITQLRDL